MGRSWSEKEKWELENSKGMDERVMERGIRERCSGVEGKNGMRWTNLSVEERERVMMREVRVRKEKGIK